MIINTVDKIVFGFLLLAFFQLPILTHGYIQFLNGYYLSTKAQVDGYKLNAQMHEYPDVQAMIDDFKRNATPAVRTDGEQKERVLQEFEALSEAMAILKKGNLFQKAQYMFSSNRWAVLQEVTANFKPGIPLSIEGIGGSLLSALVLGFLIMWPVKALFGSKQHNA